MPATVIDTKVVSDAVNDPWTEVVLDQPLGANDQVVAIPLNALAIEPPSTYAPADPSTLVPTATYNPFVATPGSGFELVTHPDAPQRVSCRLNMFSGAGDYAIGTRDTVTNQFSTPFLRNNPRVFGVSKRTIRQGDWIFVWGIQLHPTEARSGIYLVRNGTNTPVELPLKPNVITEPAGGIRFVRPVQVNVAPGIYKLTAPVGDAARGGVAVRAGRRLR
jgi:hypothetical protein